MRALRERRPGPPVTGALIRPTVRALPRGPLATGAVVCLLAASLPRLLPDLRTLEAATLLLRAGAVALALGLAFLLDDPSRPTTQTTPAGRPLRLWLRAALVVPAAGLAWSGALLLIPAEARPPLAGLTLEAAALAVTALALAATSLRTTGRSEPGRGAAAALVTLVAGALLLPRGWVLFTAPDSPLWAEAHTRWSAVLAASLTVWAAGLPEPLRRHRLRPGAAIRP
ncbi:ABC transporter [Streptomyces sp. XM83C]|uniref:ABC transporter n=1 Tax=Streptomyces sp. XM83C TaxID=2929781 RepID=UPI001FF73D8C|nr:ABC transporter [Streptomyces sp. XM83C]MCK1823257.1 ABC transporter [Streptomyces sp. XM83C]